MLRDNDGSRMAPTLTLTGGNCLDTDNDSDFFILKNSFFLRHIYNSFL